MQKRLLVLGLGGTFFGSFAAAAAFVACGNSPATVTGNPDTGTLDTGIKPHLEATTFDVGTLDMGIIGADGQGFDVHIGHDAGDAGSAHAIDSGHLAHCSGVTGACDIVSQNCSAGSECIIVQGSGSALTTACNPDQPTEHLAAGLPCCPNDPAGNECDPSLECNGGNSCTDAASPGPGLPPGWGGSRCTPHCCPEDAGANTANCGTAGDGGTQGHCDLQIVNGSSTPIYNVCTYPQLCEPFIRPCLNGFTCTVENVQGTASCTVIFNPNGDAGLTSGQACEFGNECASGLTCIVEGDAGSCAWECHVAGQATPFDAGELNASPGHGGCPAGQTCEGLNGVPTWLGVCVP
jgi:hypothetical protein